MLQPLSKDLVMFAFTIILAVATVCTAGAQSTDRDSPTKLTSPEISGFVDSKSAENNYFYSFVAGPGEVVITLDISKVNSDASIRYEIFDEDAKSLIYDDAVAFGSSEERKIKRFVLSRKVLLILKISPGHIWGRRESGRFRLRISGAVDLSSAASLACLPKQGILRIKMKDGSIKEIDLKQTDEITIQP
ncbi:MAG: hypothetical protein JNK38_00570 [Acidobacteria bacterium]|nr:hypothetical protein [Acidobacteriota bacterium]